MDTRICPPLRTSNAAFARRHRPEYSLTAIVVVQIVGIFALLPLGPRVHLPPAVPAFITLLIAALVFVLIPRRRWAVVSLLSATLAVAASTVVRMFHPTTPTQTLDHLASLVFIVVSTGLLAAVVLGAGRVTGQRVIGAVAIYLNVGFGFAVLDSLVALLLPHAFGGAIDARPGILPYVYYSFATMTTSAYGDIVPVDSIVRSIANVEAIVGQLFPATIVARLLMLEVEARRDDARTAG